MSYDVKDADQSRTEAYLKQIARKLGVDVGTIVYDTNLPAESRVEAYLKAILDNMDYTPEGEIIGDMLKDVYDPHGTVEGIGGVDAYVTDRVGALRTALMAKIETVETDAAENTAASVAEVTPLKITLIPNGVEGQYHADADYATIKSAFDRGVTISILVEDQTDARMPLVHAEINGTNAGFLFGYFDLQLDGQRVVKRAIHYSHTEIDGESTDIWEDQDANAEYLKTSGGLMTGDISMGANAITDVQELTTADENPLILGNVIRQNQTKGVRITATTDGEGACMAPNSQNAYRPMNVSGPTKGTHAVNLAYLEQEVRDETASKNYVTMDAGSTKIVTLQNGVYFLTACTASHKGLAIAYICNEAVVTRPLEELVGWGLQGTGTRNQVRLSNSTTSSVDIYLIAIGSNDAQVI